MVLLKKLKQTVLALMTKTNYKYYLANGACIEYALSPGCSLIDVIDHIAFSCFKALPNHYAYDEILMRPELVSLLNKECSGRFTSVLTYFNPYGSQILKIETVVGPVIVTAAPNLELPIFMGSEQELKDNSFNASIEDILLDS